MLKCHLSRCETTFFAREPLYNIAREAAFS